ncbi:alcohol oxidase [Hymenopellis radicata]|nr:alcohol oxidase [Hymenopellis radicata]
MWPFDSGYPVLRPEDVGGLPGGTAGTVLASRLSEHSGVSVLILERGPIADTWGNSVPLISGSLRPDTLAKKTMSAPFAHGNKREVIMVRAEGLGGGSCINGMLYNRGVPGDYNRWAEMGHPEWGYEKMLPHFLKSETSFSHPASKFRGKTGPWVNQKFPNSLYRSISCAKTAAYSLGIPSVPDFNDPSVPAICIWDVDVLQNHGRKRVSVFHAFLPRNVAEARKKHLKICPESLVQRVVFQKGSNGRPLAIDVEFMSADPKKGGKLFFAKARKEVIVCCGAMGSPQVLMLSGIGPAKHLRSHGIEVVFDSPGVGSYFKDHIGLPLVWSTPVEDSLRILLAKPWRAAIEIVKYLVTGGGIINPRNIPDIEITPIPIDGVDPREDFVVPKGTFSFLLTLLNPKSTSTVRLKSADPAEYALCDIGMMSDPADFGAMYKGVRLSLRMAEEMKKQGYPFEGELLVPKSESDKDIEAFMREHARTTYHYSSSCRMARLNDAESPGVVDDELRVHGVDGLRVCNTSVSPDIIAAHPMALAVVMAEKCADMILLSR